MSRKDEDYHDFSNVETQQAFLTSEEFPEGPVGSSIGKTKPVTNKDTPWTEGQQFYSNFTYENRTMHQDLPRQFPGAHPTHDEKDKETEEPYTNS